MRYKSLLAAALAVPMIPATVALPVLSHPTPAAHAVAPSVHQLGVVLNPVVEAQSLVGKAVTSIAESLQQSTAAFQTVGASWDGGTLAPGSQVQVRTHSDGSWSDWISLDPIDTGADDGSKDALAAQARHGSRQISEPVWAGASDGVQTRVVQASGSSAQTPDDLKLALVDPGTSDADASPGGAVPASTAQAASAKPTIYSRASWGADEDLRGYNGSSCYSPGVSDTIKVGFVHHTDTANDYSRDDVPAIIRGIYAYHVKSNGWCDIGYNFFVDKFGRTWEGRAGGVDKPIIGAHTGGFNVDSFAASMIGDYQQVSMSSDMIKAYGKLYAWKLSRYGRNPNGSATLTSAGGGTAKFPRGTSHTFQTISGHRDAGNTTCPGDAAYSQLDDIRAAASGSYAGEQPVLTGGLDSVTPVGNGNVAVRGWAVDTDATDFTTVKITANGTYVGTTVANTSRPDVHAAHPQYSENHGFETTVPARGGATVCAGAVNQGAGTDTNLGCLTVKQTDVTPTPTTTPTPVATARSIVEACPPSASIPNPFADVPNNSAHVSDIACVAWWDVTSGTTSSTYSPSKLVTRGQMAAFLARLITTSGRRLPYFTRHPFNDVHGQFADAINKLATAGVVSGKSGRRYDPAGPVTRDQMATFLVNAYEYRTGKAIADGPDYFADDDSDVHEDDVNSAALAGFTGGTGGRSFEPTKQTNREQMAAFLSRVLDLLVDNGVTARHS